MSDSDERRETLDANLKVVHNPARQESLAFFGCFIVCLAMIAGITHLLLNPENDFLQSSEVPLFALFGFSLAAFFFLGSAIKIYFDAKKEKRIYFVEQGFVHCFDGHGKLWQEPVANYQQLLWRQQVRSHITQYGRNYYTVQLVTLEHSRAQFNFEVACHQDSAVVQARVSPWADVLALPIFRAEDGQAVERSAAEMSEKSLLELGREGRLVVDFDFSQPLPSRITCDFNESSTNIIITPPLFLITVIAPLIVALGFVRVFRAGSFQEDMMPLFICSGVAFVLVLSVVLIRQVIQLDKDCMSWTLTCLRIPLWRRRFSLREIQRIYTIETMPVRTIVQSGKKKLLIFGLSLQAATWLAGFLQNSILSIANSGK